MSDPGKLLAVGVMFVGALYLFANPITMISFTQSFDEFDNFPGDNNVWNDSVKSSNNINDDGSTLYLEDTTVSGYWTSQIQSMGNSSLIDMATVTVDMDRNGDGTYKLEMRGLDKTDSGIYAVQESDTITLKSGTNTYELNSSFREEEYDAYQFRIDLASSNSQSPTVSMVSSDYQRLDPLNNKFLDNLLAFVMVIFGIILVVSG